jgi:hypothetical protein
MAVYIVVTAASGLRRTGSGSQTESLAQIAVLTLILVAPATLRPVLGEAGLFPEPAPAVGPRDFTERAAASPNPALVAALEWAMTVDRASGIDRTCPISAVLGIAKRATPFGLWPTFAPDCYTDRPVELSGHSGAVRSA